jgi:D-alanyl-D-alanine carboxypeptidase/D-alanyl-D-alanine-endopeptidase (penicillin-binding protein 4)
VLTGLPVAGFTGSLAERFEDADDPGRGLVRTKTGTLTGVSGLAGTVTDRTGAPMVFALLADDIALLDTLDARAALDDIAGALASCRCGTAGTVAP